MVDAGFECSLDLLEKESRILKVMLVLILPLPNLLSFFIYESPSGTSRSAGLNKYCNTEYILVARPLVFSELVRPA